MPYQLNNKLTLWLEPGEIEPEAINQIFGLAKLPVVDGVAIMPDCHYGKGTTVGSVIASRVAVIPAAVGVDIGCGMAALRTNLTADDLPESLKSVRAAIEDVVPLGPRSHAANADVVHGKNPALKKEISSHLSALRDLRCGDKLKKSADEVRRQIGTLGGGNHFIEVCLDERDRVWVMLHSGSRNIGLQIATRHIGKARELLAKRGVEVADKDLAWLERGEPELEAYVHDVHWAQAYARLNRLTMIHNVFEALRLRFPKLRVEDEVVHCHHNYISEERFGGDRFFITRKGAVSAAAGQLGIIPGSMGTASYIVRGRGNPASFNSCSHGAGRRMSRNEAKRRFSEADLAQQTDGVECRKDAGVIDEIPGAYKNIDEVMARQEDLVEVLHRLKAVLCVKG